jgi:hypothetical protein
VGAEMRVLMVYKIQSVFYSLGNFFGLQLLQLGLVCAVAAILIVAPYSSAVAQFPGVGSEAPSGVATTADDSGGYGAADTKAAVSDAGNSDTGGNTLNGASDVSSQSNYGGGSSDYRSIDIGSSTLNVKTKHYRKQLFIKKVRLEFAAIELVERKTGLPFSRGDIPRYLDELRSDLKTIVNGAENGEVTDGALKSIARDVYYIDTHLNDHLDQLLEQAGHRVPKKPFFAIKPALPKASIISGAQIDALSLKFELAEYGKKALQAMGAKRY